MPSKEKAASPAVTKKGLMKTCLYFSVADMELADKICAVTGEPRSQVLRDAIRRGLKVIFTEHRDTQALSERTSTK